eukprot:TRINITY_DN1209_c0_g1_i1.p1 TRINITY_DN1209_c0_g1~~TRINITY_DN1209_c0_g1_i1.p1  ORF type:complete len:564 (+),score=68.73 TRINITY_DN1209_c0_g1_i1:152-1693(+)
MLNASSTSLYSALRAREQGLIQHRPDDHLLGALRTTPEDEFSFWNVEPPHAPHAVPPFSISFSTTALYGHALLAADEDGVLTILDTRRSFRAQLHAFQFSPHAPPARFRAHDNAIFDAIWLNSDDDVASASGDTSVRVFDVERHIRKATCRGASGSVKAVRTLANSPYILATASRDGGVRVFDLRTPTFCDNSYANESYHVPLFHVRDAHVKRRVAAGAGGNKRRRVQSETGVNGSVTALVSVPHSAHLFFTAGAADGTIKLWDLRKFGREDDNHLIYTARPGEQTRLDCERRRRNYGLAALDIDASGTHLIASATDSSIYMYNVRNMDLGYTHVLGGHKQTSFYIRAKFSPCGRFVGSGSADSKVYIWDTQRGSELGMLDPILMLDAHRGGDAAGVDWCRSETHKLVTYSDDSTARVWRMSAGCRASGVDEGDGSPCMGARRVRVTRRRVATEVDGAANRRLRDSDIRSYFKCGGAARANGASGMSETDAARSRGASVVTRSGRKRVLATRP